VNATLDALNCWENEELLIPKKNKKLLKSLFDSMAMGKAKKKIKIKLTTVSM
jgi:hypothetical protein